MPPTYYVIACLRHIHHYEILTFSHTVVMPIPCESSSVLLPTFYLLCITASKFNVFCFHSLLPLRSLTLFLSRQFRTTAKNYLNVILVQITIINCILLRMNNIKQLHTKVSVQELLANLPTVNGPYQINSHH